MATTAPEAFAALSQQLAPGDKDLVNDAIHASVFEAFKDVKSAAHPDRIAEIVGRDFIARGLMAHALFLAWNDRREGEFLLERVREHMMTQLRDGKTPLPYVYQLGESLTRFCDAWKMVESEAP